MDKNKRERKTTPSVTEKLDETGIKEEIRINETLKKTNKTKKHLAILLSSFGGTVSFCVCLVLFSRNIASYNEIQAKDSKFQELNNLPVLQIHREGVRLGWKKKCDEGVLNCKDEESSWEPMLVKDEANADCGFYSANIFFAGKFRKITLIMACLGRNDGQTGSYFVDEARAICKSIGATLPRPETKDDILSLINFAMQIHPRIFKPPERTTGDTAVFFHRSSLLDYTLKPGKEKLADSEGKQLEAISFISRDAFGKYNRQFSTLKVFRNDESLRGKIRVVNYKWNFQPVARDQPSLLVTLVCYFENGFYKTTAGFDGFTWFESAQLQKIGILEKWEKTAWKDIGQTEPFGNLTWTSRTSIFYMIAIKDTEKACNLLGGKMIETDDEMDMLLLTFQSMYKLFTSDQLEGLQIPIKVGFSELLDKKQNCTQQVKDSSSNFDIQNGMSSSCESAVFDDRFHGKNVKINPAGTLLRNGNNEAVTTLQLNWYNYLKGNNFLKLSFHSSAFFELADVICVGE